MSARASWRLTWCVLHRFGRFTVFTDMTSGRALAVCMRRKSTTNQSAQYRCTVDKALIHLYQHTSRALCDPNSSSWILYHGIWCISRTDLFNFHKNIIRTSQKRGLISTKKLCMLHISIATILFYSFKKIKRDFLMRRLQHKKLLISSDCPHWISWKEIYQNSLAIIQL